MATSQVTEWEYDHEAIWSWSTGRFFLSQVIGDDPFEGEGIWDDSESVVVHQDNVAISDDSESEVDHQDNVAEVDEWLPFRHRKQVSELFG